MAPYRFRGIDPRVTRAFRLAWAVFLLNTCTFITGAFVVEALSDNNAKRHRRNNAEMAWFALSGCLFSAQCIALQRYVQRTWTKCKHADSSVYPPRIQRYLWPRTNCIVHVLLAVALVVTATGKANASVLKTAEFLLYSVLVLIDCTYFLCSARKLYNSERVGRRPIVQFGTTESGALQFV